jgi:hypothetical protein
MYTQADKHSLEINDRHTVIVYDCKFNIYIYIFLRIERKQVNYTRMYLHTGLLVVN